MTYPCAYCATTASMESGCPACGRGPDPDAIEVVRTDAEIVALTQELAQARQAASDLEQRLAHAWARRQAAATRVRASVLATRTPPVGMPAALPIRAPRSKEASTKLVQNVLFLLGGLLLAIAAIVFTAVAWTQFGLGGRAVLLASFTGAALGVPPLALRRNLAATAETVAAVGLLLVLLDGYAAWYVNLFGVADRSPWGYAGAVCAVTAAVAAGYEQLTGLTGPRFAALLVAQPVLPLLVVPTHPGAAGWSLTFAAVALLDIAVLGLRRAGFRVSGVGMAAYPCGAAAVVVAGAWALSGLSRAVGPADAALAGSTLIVAALVVVAAAVLARNAIAQAVAGALVVLALGVAAGRYAVLLGPGSGLLRISVVALVVAVLAAIARRWLPPVVTAGPRFGALALAGLPTLAVLRLVAAAATRTLAAAQPVFHAAPGAAVPSAGWQLPVTVAALAAALIVTLPAAFRREIALAGAALAALALPAALHLPWWIGPVLDLLVAAGALVLAIRDVSRPAATRQDAAALGSQVSFGAQVAVAVLLIPHAVATGFGHPGVAAGVLCAVAALGLAIAALTRTGPRRRDLGAAGLLVGLLVSPAIAWTATVALSFGGPAQSRTVVAVAALLVGVLHLIGRRVPDRRPFALAAVLVAVAPVPLWALLAGDSPVIYAAVGLLLLAATPAVGRAGPGRPAEWRWTMVAALLLVVALLIGAGPTLVRVLLEPYARIALIWTGPPAPTPPVPVAVAVAMLVSTLAAGLAGYLMGDRRIALWSAVPVLAVAVPVSLAAVGAPWPVVPAVELLFGLAGLLAAALRAAPTPVPVVAALLAAAGMAGALPTRASTLAALGAVLVVAAVAGTAGRTPTVRVCGWLAAVGSAFALAGTAGSALELSLHTIAFLVLGAAAAALALAWTLLGRRPFEARAVETAAHAGAAVALLLTVGSARPAAAVCTLWGLALGLRALRPAARRGYVVAASVAELAAWFLLMAAAGVGTLEAYTVPAAAVALLAGLLARRTRPSLSSWTAYGPALAAALLPSLASIAAADGQYLRRLLLGLSALAIVIVGANARLRAPVILGGGVLILVALHEVAQVWDLIPRWIPLAAGGLVLVLIATTVERRRRDVDRFRAALTRMT